VSIRILTFLIIGVFSFLSAQAQKKLHTNSKKAIKYYREAEHYYIRRQYFQAIEMLRMALQKDDEFVEAHYRIGTCYKYINQDNQTAYHYEQVLNHGEKDQKYPQIYYSLGDIYFNNGNYSAAKEKLTSYLALNPRNPIASGNAKRLLKNAEFAAEHIKDPRDFHLRPLAENINRFALQYFPVLTVDEKHLIFTRREGFTYQYDEDIFISNRISDTSWTNPVSISNNINTSQNEGTCTISADGKMLIFTSCEEGRVYGSCDLFVSYKTGDRWSKPSNMGLVVNSRAWESQPSLSADGRTLYFVSNRPGGYGKRDIWVAKVNDKGIWGKPVNLGPKINTSGEEVSPFIHVNGQTLFFSSDYYPGFGGFDIFYVEKSSMGWTEPENVGYPLNTHHDQVSLFITADGKEGYYSFESVRDDGYRNSMLYKFDVPAEIHITNKSNYLAGKVYDADTREVLAATIELFDLEKDSLVSKVKSDPVNGEYFMVLNQGSEYALYAARTGYLFESMTFDYKEKQKLEPVFIDIYLDPVKPGSLARLNNVFFDFDKYELKEKSKTELKKVISFIKQNPELSIEISGHTDNVGTDAYNQQLSLNRAKAVYNYLVEHDINPERLSYSGYGATRPVAHDDSEESHQLNRRIEFRILN